MTKFKYDLHMHTNASDGKLSWKELLNHAKDLGLKGISITNHNTLDSVAKVIEEAKKMDLRYISGTEIKTTCKKQIADYVKKTDSNAKLLPTQEILIYGMDYNNKEFLDLSAKHLEGKKEYVVELCRLLNQHRTSEIPKIKVDEPIRLDAQKIIENAGNYVGATKVIEEVIELYKQYVDLEDFGKNDVKTLVTDVQGQALKLMKDDPFYGLDILEGLKKAKEWGKIVSFAHPFTGSRAEMTDFYKDYLFPLLIDNGLDGIECSYPEHNKEHMNFIKETADKYNLILTGGSDFHRKEDDFYALGSCGVDKETFDKLYNKVK